MEGRREEEEEKEVEEGGYRGRRKGGELQMVSHLATQEWVGSHPHQSIPCWHIYLSWARQGLQGKDGSPRLR